MVIRTPLGLPRFIFGHKNIIGAAQPEMFLRELMEAFHDLRLLRVGDENGNNWMGNGNGTTLRPILDLE